MGWIILLLLILLLTIIGFAGYIINNLLRQVEQLEDRDEQFAIWFLNFKKDVDLASTKLKNLDRIGSFEADDETGFIFKEIKKIQRRLDEYFG